MRITVLGGSGYIGRHLVASLVRSGADVTAVARGSVKQLFAPLGGVRSIEGSILDDHTLKASVTGADCVVHLVSCTNPKSSNENRLYDAEANILGSVRLLDACIELQVRRVVFASSGGTIYGVNSAERIREDAPTDPICAYGISKLAIEKYLNLYHRHFGLEFCALRVANPYGGDQAPAAASGVGAIAAFFDRVRHAQPIEVWGDGQVVRDYVHMSDVVGAFLRAVRAAPVNAAVNVGTGLGTSLTEMIEAIGRTVGKRPIVHHAPARAVDVPRNVLDVSRAAAVLEWQPTIGLYAGLAMMNEEGLRKQIA
jgi:UDP-glucose 4-epimerase